MAVYELYNDADQVWDRTRSNPAADQDIISFCARAPHLLELAFSLADHGHIYAGQVARLSIFTIGDLAGGDRQIAEQMRVHLQRHGLDTGMRLDGWDAPND